MILIIISSSSYEMLRNQIRRDREATRQIGMGRDGMVLVSDETNKRTPGGSDRGVKERVTTHVYGARETMR